MFVTEPFQVHGTEVKIAERASEGGKIDAAGAVLTIDHLLFLHVKGDNRELADARIARQGPQDRHQSRGIKRLESGRKGVLRGKIDQHLDVKRGINCGMLGRGTLWGGALHRRLLLKLVTARALDGLR